MHWTSLSEFLAMDGQGVFVWPSFLISAVCMVVEVIMVRRRFALASGDAATEKERLQ